jgi:hypothetical protein
MYSIKYYDSKLTSDRLLPLSTPTRVLFWLHYTTKLKKVTLDLQKTSIPPRETPVHRCASFRLLRAAANRAKAGFRCQDTAHRRNETQPTRAVPASPANGQNSLKNTPVFLRLYALAAWRRPKAPQRATTHCRAGVHY